VLEKIVEALAGATVTYGMIEEKDSALFGHLEIPSDGKMIFLSARDILIVVPAQVNPEHRPRRRG